MGTSGDGPGGPSGLPAAYRHLGGLARRVLSADARLLVRAAIMLPPRVAWFYARAHLVARGQRDQFSLMAPVRPEDLRPLLALASRRRHVVELGTGTGWTTIALALADRSRRVTSYDPIAHPERNSHLRLAGAPVSERINLRPLPGQVGPVSGDPPAEFLFIDIGGHLRADTATAFAAWCVEP